MGSRSRLVSGDNIVKVFDRLRPIAFDKQPNRLFGVCVSAAMFGEFPWAIFTVSDQTTATQFSPAIATDEDVRDVAATRAGDSEAYARLVRRHQPEITNQMRRFSRDSLACEELVHDVFVEAYLSLPSYRGSSPWLHWLRKIAVRVGYRFWTRRETNRRTVQISSEDWQRLRSANPAPGNAQEAADLVAALLGQLPPSDRLILTLLYLDECSMADAAGRAGWTVTGAKLRAFRARNKLKELIERGDS